MRARLPLSLGTLVIGALLAGTGAALSACSSPADDSTTQPAASAPASEPAPATAPAHRPGPSPAAATAVPGVPPGTGRVLEAIDAGTYTYVRVDLGGKDAWAAGPQVTVKAGDTVTLPAGMPMANYHSKTLDRTFPVVYFVGAIELGAGTAAVPDAAAVAAAHKNVVSTPPVAAAPVARLDGGQSVEEIVTKCADFAGKDVAVRGRVVKYNAGIMGSNWIHIQDGTGASGTNDLTVTTDAVVAVGDVVVVRGKVTTDKDFGAGYKYAVIVEKAAVTKE